MNFRLMRADEAFDQMEFIVRNHPEPKDELARALQAMTAALRTDADTAGESRGNGLRVAFFDPLVVDLKVAAADREAHILRVRLRAPLF
ncbi:hypothetical protein [Gemmata sp.]|uniref:hypothetical protein n=1 Tax=Gemmata sp. TaxID=1914242 RepID=UPI003F703F3B